MLNGSDPGVDAVVQTGAVVSMAGDFEAFEAGFVHDGVCFFDAEIRYADDFAVGREAEAVGAVDFDEVGAVIELFADGFARFPGAVDGLNADGNGDLGRITFQAVATGGGDAARGNFHARAGNQALVDGVANIYVAIHGAFGFDVAQGGEAGFEGAFCAERGEDSAVLPGLLEEDVVVFGDVSCVDHDVGVAIDEAGEDGGLAEVDDVGASGDLDLVGGRDSGDFFALDDDDLIAEHLAGADVEEMTGADVSVGRVGGENDDGRD